MQTISELIKQLDYSLHHNAAIILKLIGVVWVIQIINALLKYRLNCLGIVPRTFYGVIGIACSPFLHSSFNHLLFNTIPFFILANLMALEGLWLFYIATVSIILLSGVAIWLFARRGIHIGASGLVMGYLGFLLVNAIVQHTALSIVVALGVLYYLGGLLTNLFPREVKTSWEGHVFGFLSGIVVSILLKLH